MYLCSGWMGISKCDLLILGSSWGSAMVAVISLGGVDSWETTSSSFVSGVGSSWADLKFCIPFSSMSDLHEEWSHSLGVGAGIAGQAVGLHMV